MNLDERKLGTMLAALRFWQDRALVGITDDSQIGGLRHTATKGGTIVPLTVDEIDVLCEQLICEAPLGPIVVAMEGGLLSSVATYDQRLIDVDVLIIDYDVEGADESEIRKVKQHDGTYAEALLGEDRITLATIDMVALLEEETDEIDYEASARLRGWECNDDSGWHHKHHPGKTFATAREAYDSGVI